MDAIGPVVAVLSFVYMLIWGRKSIGEIIQSRKERRDLARQNAAAPATTARVFISYSRRDLAFVELMVWDLRAAGLEVWYDLAGLEVGSRWGKEIQNAIRQSQYCILVLTPNSVDSEWVEREYLFASKLQLRIIPILQSACEMPLWAVNLQYIDMQGKKYQGNRDVLLRALDVPSSEAAKSGRQQPALSKGGAPSTQGAHRAQASTGSRRLPSPHLEPRQRHRWVAPTLILGVGLLALVFTVVNLLGLLPVSPPATPVPSKTPSIVPSAVSAASSTPPPTPQTPPVPTTDPLIKRALTKTANNAPLYQTGFDYWGDFWQPVAGARIEKGNLVASAGSGFVGAHARILTAPDFGYSFAFRMPDPTGNHGPCETAATNGLFETSEWKGFDILFHPYGYVELGRSVWPGNYERIAISQTTFDFSNFNTVTVVVLGNEIAVYINAEPAIAMVDPEGSEVYTEQTLGGYAYQVCEFDDFRLWDLTGVRP